MAMIGPCEASHDFPVCLAITTNPNAVSFNPTSDSNNNFHIGLTLMFTDELTVSVFHAKRHAVCYFEGMYRPKKHVPSALRAYFSKLGRKAASNMTPEQRSERARNASLARIAQNKSDSHALVSDSHANGKPL